MWTSSKEQNILDRDKYNKQTNTYGGEVDGHGEGGGVEAVTHGAGGALAVAGGLGGVYVTLQGGQGGGEAVGSGRQRVLVSHNLVQGRLNGRKGCNVTMSRVLQIEPNLLLNNL